MTDKVLCVFTYELISKKSFTASQIKQIYKLSAKRLDDAMSRYGKRIAEDTRRTGLLRYIHNPYEWEYMGVYQRV